MPFRSLTPTPTTTFHLLSLQAITISIEPCLVGYASTSRHLQTHQCVYTIIFEPTITEEFNNFMKFMLDDKEPTVMNEVIQECITNILYFPKPHLQLNPCLKWTCPCQLFQQRAAQKVTPGNAPLNLLL
ncbi:uncharacterized protein LOC110838237 isoform X2 [Zootermopsis nevadensis]|uniref:uncharacterized protein LOC110838237 isoform X2 n=1 Tax=Zootermopsis nevadensis TaxID=136037 RepID=UPI000B8ED37F|nr:uncharacterized protein LOC110838237 isoform X2 [Zootermopsis nevadensis]